MPGRLRPRTVAVTAFGALVLGAVVAPSLAFDAAAARGGSDRSAGADLVLASALVGLPYAAFVQRRLARTTGVRRKDLWLSGVHGLIALAVTASALPAVVLHTSARLHARLADAEWPVVAAWTALLVLAVLAGEGTRRASLRWLSADPEREPRPSRS